MESPQSTVDAKYGRAIARMNETTIFVLVSIKTTQKQR